ncbi:hypothetical protein BLNAU_23163 [Blattamonas nauphoetae]|uniref:Uncharacterized protein n=1 Tax=Blattamonas nauphoetae TaxID=2049346 RepID=A0ABQ9WR08_9EUKA|nr:hypothetical protein BLNAU_23163 [Blattamonas nauphoetae]
MEEETVPLNASNDPCLNPFPEPRSTLNYLHEPFLNFDPKSKLSFEEKSAIYCSLVALVKAEYPFDNILQDRAVQFLKRFEVKWGEFELADAFVTDLVPPSDGSLSGFVDSILTLKTTFASSPAILTNLTEADIVSKVLAIAQPRTLPISGNKILIVSLLLKIMDNFASLAFPSFLRKLNITATADIFNHREMILQKVVLPSSQFVTFLISNRYIFGEDLFPYHRPTLEFVLASPIAMTFSSFLSFFENHSPLSVALSNISDSLDDWKTEGAEVTQSAKRMMQALVYCSLVALVKAEYPFDNALKHKAVLFLKDLEPRNGQYDVTAKLITDLVPSSNGSPSGFIGSIVILLSSPHSTVVRATMLFLNSSIESSSRDIRCRLVESDLITNLLATVQPHTLTISGNEQIIHHLIKIVISCLDIAPPSSLSELGRTTAVNQSNHREMIFRKGVSLHLAFIGIECEKAAMVPSRLTSRIQLSRMTATRFCELSSDVGNALIAGADEQILGSPPIVQKWFALLDEFGVALLSFSDVEPFFDGTRTNSFSLNWTRCLFDSFTELTFEYRRIARTFPKSSIYCSLVALVKAEYPFVNALLDRAARFLKSLEPKWSDKPDYADKLVTDIFPSSAGSPSGFIDSVFTLLSSPHSRVAEAALSFLNITVLESSPAIRCRLVETDLIPNVFVTVQPHTLPISGNEEMFGELLKIVRIIDRFVDLADSFSLSKLGITDAVEKFNHREMIFQKVLLPSSQFVTFLIANRYILNGWLLFSFMFLLATHLRIGPFHRPTLEFVLASPTVMALSSCLSFVQNDGDAKIPLETINNSLREWKKEGPEVTQSAKLMIRALFSEGFEDSLEQMLMNTKG